MIFVQTVTIGAEKIRKQSGSFPYSVRRPLSWSVQEETLQNAGSGADGLMSSAQALRNAEKEPKVMCLTRTAPRFAERRIQRKPQRTFSVRLRTQAQAQTSKRRLYGERVRRRCVWPFSVLFWAASGGHSFLSCRKNGVASGGHIFSLLREKIWKKRALERVYSASRLKNKSFRFAFLSLHRLLSERPSGDRPIRFPKRTTRHANRPVRAR